MNKTNFKQEINQQARHISNVDTLEKEILRLKLRIQNLESDWENNNDILKENFVDVLWRSLFSKLLQSNQVWVNVSQMLINQPIIQQGLGRFRKHILEIWGKLFSKKQHN
jgi:hypothetical protein